ncbi:neurotrypsin-like [Terrapene carolina triunguis]|uniref:neurotrypsin-like n=1 Tax=Terrapene triunguis TaxID=2587831 RepID=UPI000E77C03F|nr:neurotrypsin-like [Terrapene carolina triunguis]
MVVALLGSQPSQNHLQSAGSGLCGVGPLGYYNGLLAFTESGSECLNWAEFPDYVQQYPDRGLGNHNYCRNPDMGATPWCFYRLASGAIGWASCDCNKDSARLMENSLVNLAMVSRGGGLPTPTGEPLLLGGPASLASEGEYTPGQGFILLDDMACTGTEFSFLDCPHSNWGQHDCSHAEDVGVRCSPETNKIIEDTAGPPVRLADGESTKEGRVEVFLNGQWGSVCDDGWTDKDAVVVCRQLGYSGAAKARTMAYFGEGHGPIHLDNVECSGTERTLGECVKPDNGIHNCWHSEDAGVSCDYMEEKAQDTRNAGSASGMCGMHLLHRRKKRIIGGNKSLRGGWPWQASLRLKGFHRDTRLLCGATLIHSCWVVTAAHCFKRFGTDVHRYLLRVGDYHTGVREAFEREIPVERIILHRNYRSSSNDNDIALVRMRGRGSHCLSFNRHVLPICLPDRKEKAAINRQACIISGWGDTGKSYSRTLLQGMVPLLPREDCEARYGGKFTNHMICAGNLSEDKRVDSCQGDSGGPLMCQRSTGHWVILGIISWGYGCGRKDSPGVYTKVSKFVPWIKKVTKL